ncbi:hypothetical protein C8Q80DRAFT_1271207 [Daedaleopsis nitida]|nr:hypothetical protein C8Q80DRAFT_1271207 [Daedaleopsis nitida]
MLPRLVLRALPRNYNVGVRPSLVARQQLAARTFLTTAYVAEPAAKESKTTATRKAAPKEADDKKEVAAKKKVAAKKTVAAKKPKPKAKAEPKKATNPDDPNARFKKGLLAVKLKSSERPPLKAKTSFNLFIQEQYRLSGPTGDRASFLERGKELAARWKAMSEEEKKPYVDKAAEAAIEYKKAREEYFTNVDPRIVRALNAQRKAKGQYLVHAPPGLLPRKPLTPYLRYFLDVFKTVDLPSDVPVGKDSIAFRSKKVGEMWKVLPAEEKEHYNSLHAKEKAEFDSLKA